MRRFERFRGRARRFHPAAPRLDPPSLTGVLPQSLLGADVAVGPIEIEIGNPGMDVRLGRGARLIADRRHAIMHQPGVATFGVEAGRRVVVDPDAGAPDGVVAAWLQGPVAALLLAQRTRFALHAGLVEHGGVTLALAGMRGAGKTTTAMRLARRGGRILGDDVLPLTVEQGRAIHTTTGRPLRVEPRAAAAMGWDLEGATRLASLGGKVLLSQPAVPPGPLDGVVILEEGPVMTVERFRLAGAAAVGAVRANAYRHRLLGRIWSAELFTWAGAVAAAVPVHVVRRPEQRESADDVTAMVEAVAAELAGRTTGGRAR